ncbi:MAG: 23S rRNA (adenine(2503)-C(2))-methyltransferase RlmN [Phycisphaeraceae bacterium]|nr:23S rRNA (adenine(2503)-C(2))-methyltransferase RlmN [Phycisphaeraceae bacterium]
MPDPRPLIFDLTPDEVTAVVTDAGLPRFRGEQILNWVYQQQVNDPAEMTSLSNEDRTRVADMFRFSDARPVRHQIATDGVQKLLLGWGAHDPLAMADDPSNQTECVMIPAEDRRTACISSQVGCPVGCRFCASGLDGLDGNLTRGQIVEQAWRLGRLDDVDRISHIVFMGMGEPLANFAAVAGAIETLTAEWGLHISARRITVSTVGLPTQIRRLADADLPPVTLALSLHAPNDKLRRELIPWADRVSIDQLVDACRHYFDVTGREVTLEYILLGGINDQPEHAAELAGVAGRLRANVNLIRYNEVEGLPYRRPGGSDVHHFQRILRKHHVNTHIRASRGRDIAAACGQLRATESAGAAEGPCEDNG